MARFEADLKRDLETGAWAARYGQMRNEPFFDGSLKLIVGRR